MTILKIEKIQKLNKDNTPCKHIKTILTIRCDSCGSEFIKDKQIQEKYIKSEFQFCNRICFGKSISNGVSAYKRKDTCLKNLGTEYPTQNKEVMDKSKKTVLEKYGVENIKQNKEIQQKAKDTLMKNYGVEYNFQSQEIKNRAKATCLQKYGVENVMQNSGVADKFKEIMIEKYGVENPKQVEEFKLKSENTLFEHYGVRNTMYSEEIKAKFNFKEIWKKANITKKKNGKSQSSKIEYDFYEKLCIIYGKENIDRQVITNGWAIDFYIKSIDTYIQFDGVYWHGLGIRRMKDIGGRRYKRISRTIEIDSAQNKWFVENGLKLIRITDVQFKKMEFSKIINIIDSLFIIESVIF
jgi:hypothetical protein